MSIARPIPPQPKPTAVIYYVTDWYNRRLYDEDDAITVVTLKHCRQVLQYQMRCLIDDELLAKHGMCPTCHHKNDMGDERIT